MLWKRLFQVLKYFPFSYRSFCLFLFTVKINILWIIAKNLKFNWHIFVDVVEDHFLKKFWEQSSSFVSLRCAFRCCAYLLCPYSNRVYWQPVFMEGCGGKNTQQSAASGCLDVFVSLTSKETKRVIREQKRTS